MTTTHHDRPRRPRKAPLASWFLGTVLRVAVVLVSIRSASAGGRKTKSPAKAVSAQAAIQTVPAGNTVLPPPDPKLSAAAQKTWNSDRTILWAITGNYEPHEYTTTRADKDGGGAPLQSGKPSGFTVDLASAACAVCSLRCEFVLSDTQDCWTSGGYPGPGLSAGHVDGCLAYSDTARRRLGVAFSDAVSKPRPAGILTRLDPDTGAPVVTPSSDLSDKIVAVVGGWATDGSSLGESTNPCTKKRYNASPQDGFIVLTANDPFGGPDAAMRKLLDGDADVLFVYQSIVSDRKDCTHSGCDPSLYDGLGTKYAWIHTGLLDYQLNGTTLAMTKKGSNLVDTINPCLRSVMRDTWYQNLCLEYGNRGFEEVPELCFGGDDEKEKEEKEEDDDTDDISQDASPFVDSPGPSPSQGNGQGWSGCADGRCACAA